MTFGSLVTAIVIGFCVGLFAHAFRTERHSHSLMTEVFGMTGAVVTLWLGMSVLVTPSGVGFWSYVVGLSLCGAVLGLVVWRKAMAKNEVLKHQIPRR